MKRYTVPAILGVVLGACACVLFLVLVAGGSYLVYKPSGQQAQPQAVATLRPIPNDPTSAPSSTLRLIPGPTSTARATVPTAGQTPLPNPLNVQVKLDNMVNASAVISSTGGTISVQGADGVKFTLSIPKGALSKDEKITLTPVTSVDGLPFSGGLVGAVQMAPEGLRLLQPATLTIEFKPLASKEFETVAFAYHQNGDGLYLHPSEIKGNVLTLELWHFSGDGAAQGTPGEVQAAQQNTPSNPEDASSQSMAEYLARQRQDALLGKEPDPNLLRKIIEFLHARYNREIGPELPRAAKDCAAARSILSRALGFSRQVQLLGLEDEFKSEIQSISDTVEEVLIKCGSYQASGQDQGVDWSGTICNLGQPFTLTALSAGSPRLEMPFKFVPSSPEAGSFSDDVTAFGVHWVGSGSYTVEGKGPENLTLVVNATNSCAIAPAGTVCLPYTARVTLTALGTECSKP